MVLHDIIERKHHGETFFFGFAWGVLWIGINPLEAYFSIIQ